MLKACLNRSFIANNIEDTLSLIAFSTDQVKAILEGNINI